MKTCFIAIGNSDDKLLQEEWAQYTREVMSLIRSWTHQIYAQTYSPSNDIYQNAVFLFQAGDKMIEAFRKQLPIIARKYHQDSIGFGVAEGETLLYTAEKVDE